MSSSLAAQHSEWLSLVEISGPFLTLPVLKRALPLGLDPTPLPLVDDLRVAWKEVGDDDTLTPRWIRWVLNDLLELPSEVVKEGTEIGPALTYVVPEHGVRLRPDFAIVDPESASDDKPARMLVMTLPLGTALDERLADSKWSADAIDRMAELCRGTGVRLGLVTNGEHWAIVDAPVGGATGAATWDANLWLEERLTLDAFTTLLGIRRFFSVAETDTLEAMLAESANAEAEVTDQLGKQVRSAVELLVDAMSRANRDRGGSLFDDLTSAQVYEAAVTVMMRLVFLLSAEERGLFLLGDETYDATYAVSTLRGQLEEEANTYGEEVIARRTDAWHRLLATFRMVFGGAQHENLRLPAYGGSLFDPDRFPFLEGRHPDEPWRSTPSNPLPIDNRTVLHILGALQILTFKDRRGVKEARRLSFRALDVEQIGHVYEGLLDHSAVRVDEVAVGLIGKKEREIALELIEAEASRGAAHLVDFLAEETGLSRNAAEKALSAQADAHDLERLTSACDNNRELADRIAPYLALLRSDLADLPVVYLPNSMYVTQSSDRRSSGTYYTPRVLAEEMVRFTLEPLVYSPGPAEGTDPTAWVLKSSTEILGLKICDMAMGSGAFLVAACRYLSARLLEAWEIEGVGAGDLVPLSGDASVAMPLEEVDREILARRLVADSCLYGVDRNPMAVEMAKLSTWLVTLAKDRPFTFVDHALRCGDSLLGITDLRQLDRFHLDPAAGRELHGGSLFDPAAHIEPLVKAALEKRRELEAFPVVDVRDAERKRQLLDESSALLNEMRLIGDIVVGAALSSATHAKEAYGNRLLAVATDVAAALDDTKSNEDRAQRCYDLKLKAEYWLDEGRPPITPDRRCLHWPLEFPEVFLDERSRGFDAVIGNPPFMGGTKISAPLGGDYREYIARWIAGRTTNRADLVTFFFLRAASLSREFTLIATSSVTSGSSREVGLDALVDSGWSIFRANRRRVWPGTAAVDVCVVWLTGDSWTGTKWLDGTPVAGIDTQLDESSGSSLRVPLPIHSQRGRALLGSKVNGKGFVLTREEGKRLIQVDPAYGQVVKPLLTARALNDSPSQQPDAFAIDFQNWPLDRAQQFPAALAILEERVKPQRDALPDSKKHLRQTWWQFEHRAPSLYAQLNKVDSALAIAAISNTLLPLRVSSSILFTNKIVVVADNSYETFGVLSSAFHQAWCLHFGSARRAAPSYEPFNFETYALPPVSKLIHDSGERLCDYRTELMLHRSIGITKLYTLMHDVTQHSDDICELRRLHTTLDESILSAYGWTEIDLDYGFHQTRQGERYTIGSAARRQVLDRLLQLNWDYANEESSPSNALAKRKREKDGSRPKKLMNAVSEQLLPIDGDGAVVEEL